MVNKREKTGFRWDICLRLPAVAVLVLILCSCASSPISPLLASQAADPVVSASEESRIRSAERNEDPFFRADVKMQRMDELIAQQRGADLQSRLTAMGAKISARGLVVTLRGLFASGKSDLNKDAADNLDILVAFLKKYPERTAIIEGHSDSVGAEGENQDLSQNRADNVKAYLMDRGISSQRLSAFGMGENYPTTGNDPAIAYQRNRRVEIIISNAKIN